MTGMSSLVVGLVGHGGRGEREKGREGKGREGKGRRGLIIEVSRDEVAVGSAQGCAVHITEDTWLEQVPPEN